MVLGEAAASVASMVSTPLGVVTLQDMALNQVITVIYALMLHICNWI